jgi:F0F1-type ATP synthase membrane subunit c/vacuolar-type H+-ATPase subunit K
MGAAYGTAKSGMGIQIMGVQKPELVMKSVIPVVMAGVIGIYGLIIAVIIGNKGACLAAAVREWLRRALAWYTPRALHRLGRRMAGKTARGGGWHRRAVRSSAWRAICSPSASGAWWRACPLLQRSPDPPAARPPRPRLRHRAHARSISLVKPKTHNCAVLPNENGFPAYSNFEGYASFAGGMTCGLSGLSAGIAIGIAGDTGVRASAQQSKLFVGMVLILIFSEALGLYGLIVGLILASRNGAPCMPE